MSASQPGVRFTPTCVGTTQLSICSVIKPRGSPPRAWGQLDHFIQECAAIQVHPHVRGDNQNGDVKLPRNSGSPPRAWGQRHAQNVRVKMTRFTPTCVGTTANIATKLDFEQVHPHVRGDNFGFNKFLPVGHGSPPRAWGQRSNKLCHHSHHRFTPTCVGTTCRPLSCAAESTVHPHVRGDNVSSPCQCGCCKGSPPRAWGQLSSVPALIASSRFTPTCVGTTEQAAANCTHRPRFTPTCVGTTPPVVNLDDGGTVHPHVRGDNMPSPIYAPPGSGSPPRAWGQRPG